MTKIFQHSVENPYHISVGAVLVNEEGKICLHHRTTENVPEEYQVNLGGLSEVRILMRESLENDETLEECVYRGIEEEFGAKGEIVRYLGSIRIRVDGTEGVFEKTTLYFQVKLISLGKRSGDDDESFSELEWVEPMRLIQLMKEQGEKASRTDLDESKIIETYVSLT